MDKVVYPEIKQYRVECGATVADLETASGVSRKTISKMETGKDIKVEKMFQIINGLNGLRSKRGLPHIEVGRFKRINK